MTGQGRAGSGKTRGLPPGMRLLNGVPVPISVDGLAVKSVTAIVDGPHAGRTKLVLDDDSKIQGCVDCIFTHTHWPAVAGHRERDHGGPHLTRNRGKQPAATANGQGQLELGDINPAEHPPPPADDENSDVINAEPGAQDADEAVGSAVSGVPGRNIAPYTPSEPGGQHTGEVVVGELEDTAAGGRGDKKTVIHVPSGDRMMRMQLGEILALAGEVVDIGVMKEKMTAEIEKWKKLAHKRGRELRKIRTLMGKANEVLKEEEED